MELLFEPEKWHICGADWRVCDQNANCYAYVLDRPDYYWAVPGFGYAKTETQRYYDSFDEHFRGVAQAEFRRWLIGGAVRDGLVRVSQPVKRAGHYLSALFFAGEPDNLDFHWYRKDDDGSWSHKDGWHVPRNRDAHGMAIHDPLAIAAETDYPVFGGFFLVPRQGVKLKRDFPLIG